MLQLQNNPWLGLASYEEKDADMFFGREKEKAFLCDVIKQNYCTVIYGKSGMGKTSLINAGLIPTLSKDNFLPISIKLEHNSDQSYSKQIIDAVINKLTEWGGEVECDSAMDAIVPEKYKLWSFFHTTTFWSENNHRIIPLVFIDQFEEIFTICENKSDVSDFFSLLNELFQPLPPDDVLQIIENANSRIVFNETANFRIVISMREDFLARLEDYSYNVPILRKTRIGISALNGLQALDVILKPAFGIIDHQAAMDIVKKVTKLQQINDTNDALRSISVETCILSLFCTQLYKKAVELKRNAITSDIIEQFGDNIINDYYHECMKQISKESVTFLEDKLLTTSGYRNSVAYEDVVPQYVLKKEVDLLEKARLIRIEIINKTARVEFTHDVLCGVAIEHKIKRSASTNRNRKVKSTLFTTCEAIMASFMLPIPFLNWDTAITKITENLGIVIFYYLFFYSVILLRIPTYTSRYRSVTYSLFTLFMGILASVAFGAFSEVMIPYRYRDFLYLFLLVYELYIFISFIVSLMEQSNGSFKRLFHSACLIKEPSPMIGFAMRLFVILSYLVFMFISAWNMNKTLTCGMFLCIAPIILLETSIWNPKVLKNKKSWIYCFAAIAGMLSLYYTQFTHSRYLTYITAIYLLAITIGGVRTFIDTKKSYVKYISAFGIWLLCFMLFPTIIAGYNIWMLDDYIYKGRGVIDIPISIGHDENFIILENKDGKQGAFSRTLKPLIPAQYNHIGNIAVGSHFRESEYTIRNNKFEHTRDNNILKKDVVFYVNNGDSTFISEHLDCKNAFSKEIVQNYIQFTSTDLTTLLKNVSAKLSKEDSISTTTDERLIYYNDIYSPMKDLLDPDIYRKLSKYYTAQGDSTKATQMLAKALQFYAGEVASTQFLEKGYWGLGQAIAINTFVRAIIYTKTGYLQSDLTEEYKNYFLSDTTFQQFIKTFVVDAKPDTILNSESNQYDGYIMSVISDHHELLSIRNKVFNDCIQKVFNRNNFLINESFALIFMGDYEKAKETSDRAIVDSTNDNLKLIASTNLVTSLVFLGKYDEAKHLVETYHDSIINNGTNIKFFRDFVIDDFKEFERVGITSDIPKKEYSEFKKYIDPNNNRHYSSLYQEEGWDFFLALTELYYKSFSYSEEPTVSFCKNGAFLLDNHGEMISPRFDMAVFVHRLHYVDKYDDDYDLVMEPIFIYSIDDKRGFYDLSKLRYLTKAVYDHAWIFSEGLAAVVKNDKLGFINTLGKIAIPLKFKYMAGYDYVFHDGQVRVWDESGVMRIINKNGRIISTPSE